MVGDVNVVLWLAYVRIQQETGDMDGGVDRVKGWGLGLLGKWKVHFLA